MSKKVYISDIKDIDIRWENLHNFEVTGITHNSKEVQKGDIFVALSGTNFDGKKYIPDAIENGACAIICAQKVDGAKGICFGISQKPRATMAKIHAKLLGNPEKHLTLIAITGTNGKTTTSFFIKNILETSHIKTGIIGTIGCFYGKTYYKNENTTPDPLLINKHLHAMYKQGITHVVLEVSSHALIQDRVSHLDFKVAIFTNLTRDHLNYHKTFENYKAAKNILFLHLPEDSYAIANIDDNNCQAVLSQCKARIYFYGKNNTADIIASNIKNSIDKLSFELGIDQKKYDLEIQLIGDFNVYNALAACGCAKVLGIDISNISKGLRDISSVRGRMEKIPNTRDFHVFIDFAHTDSGLKVSLETLKKIKQEKLIVVFGCGGNRDKGKRVLMGKIAYANADYSIITSDNPRDEDPLSIAKSIESGFTNQEKYCIILNREQAIVQALKMAQKDDIILIAGKGHETEQIVKNKLYHFDDKETVERALKKLE